MAKLSTRELLTALVSSFGDADAITALLSPDAQWSITPSVGVLGSPIVGRDAIGETLTPSLVGSTDNVRVTLHHMLVERAFGVRTLHDARYDAVHRRANCMRTNTARGFAQTAA